MSLAYDRGYAAGSRGRGADACPYAGRTDGSFDLMMQWLTGNFDALTGIPRVTPPQPKRARRPIKHWIRSNYVRSQLEALSDAESHRPTDRSRRRGEAFNLKSRGRRDG